MEKINPFALPYFLRSQEDGELHSRARIIIQGLESGATGARPPKWAKLALTDLLIAEECLCNGDDDDQAQDKRVLSEAILSALALGLELGTTNEGKELIRQIMAERGRKGGLSKAEKHSKKDKVIAMYMKIGSEYPSKDNAAEAIANQLEMPFSTVRDYLKSL